MKQILYAKTMKEADWKTIDGGTPSRELMERAAKAVLTVLEREFDTSLVLFLCGGGNNGGDGLAAARFFAEKGGRARVLYGGGLTDAGAPDVGAMSAECARQYALLPESVDVLTEVDTNGVSAVVDALFGIGLTRPIEGRAKDILTALRKEKIPTLAVDLPSGINADTGEVMGAALPAKKTLAIAAKKWGHLLYPAASLCGEIEVADIGIKSDSADGWLLKKSDLDALPPRPARGHKGTFGRVLVVGGSVGMSGAAYFSAKAALRAGCGLVEIFAPRENRVIYQTQLPEALLTLYDPEAFDATLLMDAMRRADAVALGMGLSQGETAKVMTSLALEFCVAPLLLDADALNLIAKDEALQRLLQVRIAPTVITPHLGEMSRLCGKSIIEVGAKLPQTAASFATENDCVVVLKDTRTVISNGKDAYLNIFGNSGMATGGSGDVLAGIIAAFLASRMAPIDAARLGVLTHAMAGDAAKAVVGEHGLMASDILDGICKVLT